MSEPWPSMPGWSSYPCNPLFAPPLLRKRLQFVRCELGDNVTTVLERCNRPFVAQITIPVSLEGVGWGEGEFGGVYICNQGVKSPISIRESTSFLDF